MSYLVLELYIMTQTNQVLVVLGYISRLCKCGRAVHRKLPPEPLDKTSRTQADCWPTQRLGSVWWVLPSETQSKLTRLPPPSQLDTSFRSAFAVLKSTFIMLDLPPHSAQIYLRHARSPSSCLNLPYHALICLLHTPICLLQAQIFLRRV